MSTVVLAAPVRRAVGLTLLLLIGAGAATGLTLLAIGLPRYGIGAAAAAAFIVLTWLAPTAALGIIFLLAPLQQDVGGLAFAKMGPSELGLALAFPVFLIKNLVMKRPVLPGPLTLPVAAYLGFCGLSSYNTWRGEVALISLLQMALYFLVAVTVFASLTRRPQQLLWIPYAACLTGTVFASAAIASGFNMMGLHKNGIGSSLCMFTVICTEMWISETRPTLRKALAVALAVISGALVLSLSRGAWVGAAAGVGIILLMRGMHREFWRLGLLMIPAVAVAWMALPQEKREYALGFERSRFNIEARFRSFDFAKEQWLSSPFWGVGVGLRKQYDATNVVMLTLAETGVPGLAGFLAVHATFFALVLRIRRQVRQSDRLFTLLVLGVALLTAKLMHGMVDHYWSRGPIVVAWASVGMSLAVYYSLQRRTHRVSLRRAA
ncbi:MAG: O-antigen ligase family protein [Armatimonadota bacterium]